MDALQKEVLQTRPLLYLKFELRNWHIFPLLISNPQTTASPIKHLGLRLGQFASNRNPQPSNKTAAHESSSAMEPSALLSFAFLLRLSLVFCWKFWRTGCIPGGTGDNTEKLDVCGEQPSLEKSEVPSWSSSATGLNLLRQVFWQNSWRRKCKTSCIRGTDTEQRSRDMEMEAAVEKCFGNRLRTYSRPRMIDPMMTLARPDHSITRNVDDRAIMTDDVMTINYSSELSCIDVASSICENTDPRTRDLGNKWTCEQSLEGNARPQRREDGVIYICTKCIQLGFLCLIIISNRSVLRVTASSSFLYFHQLFLYLFYRGDLRYCLYFKYRFFYNLYKVQMMEVS